MKKPINLYLLAPLLLGVIVLPVWATQKSLIVTNNAVAVLVQQSPDNMDVERGIEAAQAGRYEEAIKYFKRALTVSPNDASAYNNLGNAYASLGRYKESIESIKQALRLNPNFAEAYNNLGATYLQTSEYEEAIKAFKQAIRLDSKMAWAHYSNLGRAYFALGRYEEAVKAYSQTIHAKPRYVAAYRGRGSAYRHLNQYENAIQDYTEAIRLDKREPTAFANRGWNYLHLGRGDSAAADARSYIDLKGWRDKHTQYMIVVAYLGYRIANRDSDARKILDEAATKSDLTIWPYPVIRFLRKEITALELLSLATDNDKMTEARTYIGMELSLSGHRDEALVHLRWVKEKGNRTFYEYDLALAEMRRIEASATNSGQR